MKWFKHYCDMHRGRSITALMDELGHTGLCFFLIQEMCAEKLEKKNGENLTEDDCVFRFHRRVMQQLLRVRPVGMDRLLVSCASAGLLQYVANENEIVIKMPILLNLLDRDSRRARLTRERDAQKPRLDKEGDKDKEEERELRKETRPRRSAALPSAKASGIVALYCDLWKTKYKARPVITGKDAGILRTLLKEIGEPRLSELIGGYFAHPSTLFVERRHDLGTFRLRLQDIAHFIDTGSFVNRKQLQEIEENQHYAAKNKHAEADDFEISQILNEETQPKITGKRHD